MTLPTGLSDAQEMPTQVGVCKGGVCLIKEEAAKRCKSDTLKADAARYDELAEACKKKEKEQAALINQTRGERDESRRQTRAVMLENRDLVRKAAKLEQRPTWLLTVGAAVGAAVLAGVGGYVWATVD